MRWVTPEAAGRLDVEKLPDDELAEALYTAAERDGELDLGREWDIVHYLLTGGREHQASPLSWAVLGRYMADDDRCDRYLAPADVAVVARALAALEREDLERRFAIDEMKQAGVYHAHVLSEHWLEACVDLIEDLRDAYLALARQGKGAFISLG